MLVTRAFRRMTVLAREADIHVVQLAQIHHDVYAREEHKWDYDTLTGGPRQERFPATIHIPEGAVLPRHPRVDDIHLARLLQWSSVHVGV